VKESYGSDVRTTHLSRLSYWHDLPLFQKSGLWHLDLTTPGYLRQSVLTQKNCVQPGGGFPAWVKESVPCDSSDECDRVEVLKVNIVINQYRQSISR
jgi:hypothetical protein